MKIAKKVLSVILAVVIALGTFAVVASANGNPDTAEYQVKMWLTGTVGSATWTTNAKVNIVENTDEVVGADYAGLVAGTQTDGVLEAQPGDTVFVRFYCSNNYWVNIFQTNVFYSSELIDAAEEYETQRGKAITTANLAKIHIWNSDHYWVYLNMTASRAYNAWSLQAPSFNADVAQNWPTDDEGNNLFNIEDWKFNRFNNYVVEVAGETVIFDDENMDPPASETHMFMMPVKIPDDAAPGSVYYVTIPEGLEQRTAKKAGATRLTEIGPAEGETEPSYMVDAYSILYPGMGYGNENQYYDYSQSTLKIVIPGEATPEISYDALQAKYDEVKDTDLSGKVTAANVAAFEAALNAAATMLADKDAADQNAVDNITTLLTNAYAVLKDKADYKALDAAIEDYESKTASDWTDDSWAAAADAYVDAINVDRELSTDEQATVTNAANALAAALAALKPNLSYDALQAYYDSVKDTDTAPYTDDTVAAFNSALAAAANILENGADSQAAIDDAKADLEAAYKALTEKDASYTALNAAISAYEGKTASDWTKDTWDAATAAYNAAKAVPAGLKYSDQAQIDTAATNLENALAALAPVGAANYNGLDAAIADYEGKTASWYTSATWAAATTAYNAAKAVSRDLTGNDQAIIDEAKDALVAALNALVEADANYNAVNTAVAAATAKIAETDEGTLRYSDAYIAEVNAAMAAVDYTLKAKDQATVDGYAEAINALVAAPEYRAYDYTAINDTYAAWQALNPKDYTADSWAAVQAKYDAIVWDLTFANYAKAKLQEIQFANAYKALKAAGEGDYTAVEDAIDAFEAAIAANEYTEASIEAVWAIIDSVNWDLNENYADEIAAYAAAIEEATANLVPVEYADYDALDAAITAAADYAADDYTAASYAALTAAVDAGKAVDRKLLAEDQAIVAAAAQAITDAIAALKAKADYTALNDALAAAAGYNKNAYTATSWATLEAAVNAGKAVDADLSADDQAIIAAAAQAITDAIAALVEKEVTSSVTDIAYEKSLDTHNTFTVTVDGRPAMVQFIEMDGGTRTYDRYNKNVTILSYDAAGNEINDLSRDLAYEVWTINTNLIGPDVRVRAKYLEGTSYIWDKETFDFTLELLAPEYDADVRSITPEATSGAKKGAVTTVVVIGADAQALRFVMDDGSTTTYAANKATVLENGDLQFTGKAWMNHEGVNTITVQAKVAGKWTTVGTFDYTVEVPAE